MVDFLQKYLILETVQQELVDAINNNQVVTVYYKGNKSNNVKEKTKQGIRMILPVALGLNKNGNMVVRGYLTSKGVESPWRNHTSRWKTFRLDRITSVYPRVGKNDFWQTPPEGFNPTGDKGMIQIYALANFGGKPAQGQINPKVSTDNIVKVEPEKKEPTVRVEPERKPEVPTVTRTEPEINAPEEETPENNEPEEENREQTISEWYLWLNKIINN